MTRIRSKREPGDRALTVGVALCAVGGMALLGALDVLNSRSHVLLECTRGADCFLTQASWFSREVMHFREPALLEAKVVQDRDGKRRKLLESYRPMVNVDQKGWYPLWHGWTRTPQEAEPDVARVVAWKSATDESQLRIENDDRGDTTRTAGYVFGLALLPFGLGLFILRRVWRSRPPPEPKPRVRRQRGKRWR
ncbi:hypothetical protein ACLESD_26830 [Pyxidicoccus sp. 3LFB2]